MLKLTGALLIVIGCGGVGFSMAASYGKQIRSLREFIQILDLMEGELSFRLTPLPQLCRISAERSKTFHDVLLAYAVSIESQISPDPGACMEAVLSEFGFLPKESKKYLRSFGFAMGMFDLSGQLKQLNALRESCRRDLDAMEENKDVRLRYYQALGLCAGAALAILFF